MPPFEPVIVTNGVVRYTGFRRPSGDCVWFSTRVLAMHYLADGFAGLVWRRPAGERWKVLPLTRIEP